MLTNWMSNLILTMTFIYINEILKDYTFLIFAFAVAFGAFFILKKVGIKIYFNDFKTFYFKGS